MAFCTTCGAQVTGPFCGKCGAPASTASAPAAGAGPGAIPPVSPAAPPPVSATPAVGPSAAAKTSPIVWILAGCGGLIALGAIIFGLSAYYIAHKARGYADLAKRNPALAAAKMMATINPDVEIVSVDENKGMITVREKKSGKTVTMNLDDAQKGKFVFQADGEKPVSIEAHGDGATGSLELKSEDGSVKFGAGASVKLPDWLPAYPGATPVTGFSAQNGNESGATVQFTTKDSVEQVVHYYEDALKKAGLKVNTNLMQADGKASLGIVTAEQQDGNKRTAVVNATAGGEGTAVGVTYSTPH